MTVGEAIKVHEEIKNTLEQGYKLRDYLSHAHGINEELLKNAELTSIPSSLVRTLITYAEHYEAHYKETVYNAEIVNSVKG